MLAWVLDNKEWIFGGAGVALVSGVIALLRRRQSGLNQNQTSGANSTNVQAGRDINVNGRTSQSDDGR